MVKRFKGREWKIEALILKKYRRKVPDSFSEIELVKILNQFDLWDAHHFLSFLPALTRDMYNPHTDPTSSDMKVEAVLNELSEGEILIPLPHVSPLDNLARAESILSSSSSSSNQSSLQPLLQTQESGVKKRVHEGVRKRPPMNYYVEMTKQGDARRLSLQSSSSKRPSDPQPLASWASERTLVEIVICQSGRFVA